MPSSCRSRRTRRRRAAAGGAPASAPEEDDTPERRERNRARGDKLLSAILREVLAGGAGVVGEDLGDVPCYVRPHLLERGIAGFNICHWQQAEGHAIPGGKYDECTFATYATHDHPPLPVMWDAFVDQARSGDPGERKDGQWNLRVLSEFAGLCEAEREEPLEDLALYGPRVKGALLGALLSCRSRYAALMVTDLFDLRHRFNVPGTTGPGNWTYRLPFTVAAFTRMPALAKEGEGLKEMIRQGGR